LIGFIELIKLKRTKEKGERRKVKGTRIKAGKLGSREAGRLGSWEAEK
jgi:hypothetical protein